MIVSAWEGHFRMTTNDEHGRLAGRLAGLLRQELLPAGERTEEFVYATAEHDRGWIGLDEVPLWNDKTKRPFSVADYPLGLRLPFYKRGIAEVERQSAYAALLCSMHYTNLPPEFLTHVVGGVPAGLPAAIAEEKDRQRRIRGNLGLESAEETAMIAAHLGLLQLADTLSLHLCASIGADQGDMSAPFAGLFLRAGAAATGGGISLTRAAPGEWMLSASIFGEPVAASYLARDVPSSLIADKGIAAAYEETPLKEIQLILRPE
ncbi:DUF3891 family protein [Cohnella sp. JJ-181]|uniref:DUF3891 family protein n=1 Tax=Cohnella rhizoplanae TaxID=2974897 RepID=UPI0022FF88EE|nr:DUF3891 family protein [Cohnella sp. JJ-181]CAI6086887.1 hypothetical protein COHCIP112018_05225 [Cohnella sp. JJ-181]